MIAAILGWTKLPQWAMELIVIAAVAGGIWYWQHHLVDEGINRQQAADNAALEPLIQQAKDETAQLKVKADMAEQTHAKEMAALQRYHDDNPEQPVRLCLDAHGGDNGSVPPAGGKNGGNQGAGASPSGVQPVHDGDNQSGARGAGPDIEPLLTALGAAADKVSAELRENQSR